MKRLLVILSLVCFLGSSAFAGISEVRTAYKSKDYTAAISEANKVIEEAYASASDKAEAQRYIGYCYHNQKQYDKAMAEFKKVISNYPEEKGQCAPAQRYIASCYYNQQQYDKAVPEYQKVINNYPEQPWECAAAQLDIGYCYSRQTKYDKAIPEFQKVVDLYSSIDLLCARAQSSIGHSYYAQKQCDKAIPEFQKVIGNYPGQKQACAAAQLYIANCYKAQEQAEKAQDAYLEVLKNHPAEVSQVRAALEQLDLATVADEEIRNIFTRMLRYFAAGEIPATEANAALRKTIQDELGKRGGNTGAGAGVPGQSSVSAGGYSYYTMMPSYPMDPKDYKGKWDPFALRALPGAEETYLSVTNRYNQSYTREILDVPRESLPLVNGRQIARDAFGNWFVIVEKDWSLLLATGRGPRVAGGDLALMELVGRGPDAVLAGPGKVMGASMVIDGDNRLHVVWYSENGLWYVMSTLDGALEPLREKRSWTEPRQLVKERCHPGDIMLDADGKAVVCYSRDDTVYYMPIAEGKAESAGGRGAGMPVLGGTDVTGEMTPEYDDAKPTTKLTPRQKQAQMPPLCARECQRSVMDLAPDGTVYLAFQRDFQIWMARRTPEGIWLSAECAARGLAFHPSIIVTGGRPLVCFQFEGVKNMTLGGERYLRQREAGGSSVGFAILTDQGWRTDFLAETQEIIVNRQGIWDKFFGGKLIPMLEQMGPPVLFRDRHGVAWALWQNTTRRWVYCARWMGEEFGQVQECRGPFNAPGLPVSAEKIMPATATDVGMLFVSARRVIFDRLKIPTLSLADERQVLFLDSLEVGETSGMEFVLNKMAKHPANPVLSPGPPGSKDDRHVRCIRVQKRGSTHVMDYSYQGWNDAKFTHSGLAISADGVHWQKVERLPKDLPPPDPPPDLAQPRIPPYLENPDQSDPAKKFMRSRHIGEVGWAKGSTQVQYSPDGKNWTDGPEVSVLNALRENARPNLLDTLDIPERRIKMYSRAYTVNARSCGMMWSSDLVHWAGAEHFLDACAGKGEDQIYAYDVAIIEGLYFCGYWPCTPEHRMDYALAVSRDGFNFTRVKNGESTLPVGSAGAWDSGYIFQCNYFLREGDHYRVYYRGTTVHHGTESYRDPLPELVGLATIRVNGWTYYTPKSDENAGTVTTIPIQAPAGVSKGLTVNIEGAAGQAGAFTVEVLDAATRKPIKGFSVADCIAPTRDGTAAPVTWKAGPALPVGQDIRLRFHLRAKGVRLYSFGFQ